MKGYLPAPAWHCTFYTPAGRQRRKLGSKNKRQAERRAREITEFIQREDWEALSKLDWRPRPNAGSFSIFVRAVTYGYCKTNPAASVTTKKEPVKVKDVLDDDEFGTVVALLMATLEIKSLYDMWMQLVALLGGGFAGTGALAGAVTSVAVTVLVKAYTPLHFMLYGVVSVPTCIVVGYVGSLVLPGRRGDLTGLTVYTRQDDAASP